MLLCIDTITGLAGVALVNAEKSVYLPFLPGKIAEMILENIDGVFKKAHASSADLKGVLVIQGPGSFTSLRVGIAVANQFAHQLSIPIVGLKTDAWWLRRTNHPHAFYIQSMNPEEVYTTAGIIPLADLPTSDTFYVGELSEAHQAKLPDHFHRVTELKSLEATWASFAPTFPFNEWKKYQLVEPYYGKEPSITQKKKQ